jgi:hypothetical protein
MPDINEFFNSKTKENIDMNSEVVNSPKPCSKCKEDSDSYIWNKDLFTMTWKCKNGHDNEVKVNL